jgi:hypothetical protein
MLVDPQVDHPGFLLLGVASLLLVCRHRGLWWVLLAAHLAFVVLLGLFDLNGVWPRRVLGLEFLCLTGIVALWVEAGPRVRAALLGTLLLANAWQVQSLLRWHAAPRPVGEFDFMLPFVHSRIDYMVSYLEVDWYRTLRRHVDRGETLLLLYNLSAIAENHTNPAGVLERLHLHLGHDRFVEQVLVFGSVSNRLTTLPIRPLEDVDRWVRLLDDPAGIVGYEFQNVRDERRFLSEMRRIKAAVATRFDVEYVEPWHTSVHGSERYARFRLVPREQPLPTAPRPRPPALSPSASR